MKSPSHYFISLLLLFIAISPSPGQDLNDLIPAAHYTMINTAEDALGLQPPVELNNSPFAGDEGVFCNGIQPFQVNGSWISTLPMDALDDSVFAVQVEFKISELDGETRAVLVCGESYRYLGFLIWTDTDYKVTINNNIYIDVPGMMPDENVWHELTLMYNSVNTHVECYLDATKIADFFELLVRQKGDTRIDNYHAGGGWVFKGYMRNLRVFRSEEVTALKEVIDNEYEFWAYPNPATNRLHIEYSGLQPTQYSITDVNGKNVQTGDITNPDEEIDIGSLPSEIYIIHLYDATGIPLAHKKFFKRE